MSFHSASFLVRCGLVLSLAGASSACGGAHSADSAGATDGSALTYDEGKKRETPKLSTYKVALVDTGETIEVESLWEPKVSADKEGGTKIDLGYAKDEPELQCLVAARFVTAGALLRNVANSLLSTSKQKGYEVHVGGSPKAPAISMNMLLEVPEDGKAVLVEWKMALAYVGNGTVLCQTATVGYNATLKRMFDKVSQVSFKGQPDSPVYADLGIAKKGEFVVGFEWTRTYAEAAELRTVAYTSVFGMGAQGFLGVDQVIAETTSPKGEVLLHVHASDSRENAQKLTLRAEPSASSPKNGVFELANGDDETSGKTRGLPTSFFQNASTLRRIAKGAPKPGVIRTTDVGTGSLVSIKDVPVTREAGRSVVLAESDGHARCEVDEDGRCTKYSKGSITIERIARFGQFPKVP